MKSLYLARHAKSSWKDTSLQDHERPLNKRGKRNAEFMGKLLKEKQEIPGLIISSPAKRAFSTAKRIAKEIGYSKKDIKTDDELYMAGDNGFIKAITNAGDSHNSIMLFSHNPGITEFANQLLDGDKIDNIPTGGIVKVDFDINSWSEIKDKKGIMKFFEYPKKHAEEE